MQPVQVQSPPSLFDSIIIVFAPTFAAIPDAVKPAAPPPITIASKSYLDMIISNNFIKKLHNFDLSNLLFKVLIILVWRTT